MDEHLDSGTIKLMIDRKIEIVILGEVDKAYQDMHNSALCFPMATAVRLARTQEGFEAYGCFTNLYQSVQGLSLQCFNTPTCKHMLLHPRYTGQEFLQVRLKDAAAAAGLTKYFTCDDFCNRGSKVLVSYYETIRCDCGKFMNKELQVQRKGFEVKEHRNEEPQMVLVMEGVPYLLNTSSAKKLKGFLKSYGIKCMSQIKEKVVTVCLEQISSLLLNSAVSDSPFTDAFIGVDVEMEAVKDKPLVSSTKKSTGKADAAPLTVDVLVRKSDNTILFAVANKDFMDLLFTFLTLPLMMVWDMIGFPNFGRASVERQAYKLPPYYSCHRLLPSCKAEVPPLVVSSRTKRAYESHMCLLDDEELVCLIDPKSPIRHSTHSDGGYTKDEQVFVVSDDLVVHQRGASTSTTSLVKELGIPLSDLETQKICIGKKEAFQLLEASFRSSSALTIGLGSLIASRS